MNCVLLWLQCTSDIFFSSSSRHKRVPGWSEFVHDAHTAAKDAFRLWCAWNKPKSGPVFDLFKKSRATYKHSSRKRVKQSKKNVKSHVFLDFQKNVKKR